MVPVIFKLTEVGVAVQSLTNKAADDWEGNALEDEIKVELGSLLRVFRVSSPA